MRRVGRVISLIITALFCILIAVGIIAFIGVFSVERMTAPEHISQMIEEGNVHSVIVEKIDQELQASGLKDSMNLVGVTPELIGMLLNTKEMNECVAGYVSNYAKYVLEGNAVHEVGEDEVKNAINAGISQFGGDLLTNVSEGSFLSVAVSALSKGIVTAMPSPEELTKQIDAKKLKMIRFVMSPIFRIVVLVSIMFLLLLIAALRRGFLPMIFWASISAFLGGVTMMGFSFLGDIEAAQVAASLGQMKEVAEAIVQQIFKDYRLISLCVLGVGVGLLLIHLIARLIKSRRIPE